MDQGTLLRIRVSIVVMVGILLAGYVIGAGITIAGGPRGAKFLIITALTANILIDIGLLVRLFHPYRILLKLWTGKAVIVCILMLLGFFALCFDVNGSEAPLYALAVFVGLGYMVALTVLVLIFHEKGEHLLRPTNEKRRPTAPNGPPAYDLDQMMA